MEEVMEIGSICLIADFVMMYFVYRSASYQSHKHKNLLLVLSIILIMNPLYHIPQFLYFKYKDHWKF